MTNKTRIKNKIGPNLFLVNAFLDGHLGHDGRLICTQRLKKCYQKYWKWIQHTDGPKDQAREGARVKCGAGRDEIVRQKKTRKILKGEKSASVNRWTKDKLKHEKPNDRVAGHSEG